jgi:hypothetical protein
MWLLLPQVLASFLKCIGHIIPLMDAEHAFYYTREVMIVLKREFATPDEEMKKIVLKVGVHICHVHCTVGPPDTGYLYQGVCTGYPLSCVCWCRACSCQDRHLPCACAEMRVMPLCIQVVKQCVGTEGVEAQYIKDEILPEFFKAFWTRRMALDR